MFLSINSKEPSQPPYMSEISDLLKDCVITNMRLSQERFPVEGLNVSETLAELAEGNKRLSQMMFGEQESVTSFSQSSRHSLTEYLDMMEDAINKGKNNCNEFYDSSQALNRKLSQSQHSSNKNPGAAKNIPIKAKDAQTLAKSLNSKDAENQETGMKGTTKKACSYKIIKTGKKIKDIKKVLLKENKCKKQIVATDDNSNLEGENAFGITRSQMHKGETKNKDKNGKKTRGRIQLSQPPKKGHAANITKWRAKKLQMLQQLRDVGLYVLCDNCNKTRYLPNVKDPLDLPEKWYCYMNSDPNYNSCASPDYYISPEEEAKIIINKYHAGSIVWARNGVQWWPGIVDDNPDAMQYFWIDDEQSKIPNSYHVTFFGTPKTPNAWIETADLEPFRAKLEVFEPENGEPDLKVAIADAKSACNLSILDRLRKYSFLQRYILEQDKLNENNKRPRGEKKADGSEVIKRSRRSARINRDI